MAKSEQRIHTVSSESETLQSISDFYNVSLELLLLLNQNLTKDSKLYIGQEIVISDDSLTDSLLFGAETYHTPDCSGCNSNLSNCGNNDCECDCENVVGTTPCSGQGAC